MCSSNNTRIEAKSVHDYLFTTLADLDRGWAVNQLADNITIQNLSFSTSHNPPLGLPGLGCSNITLHNCHDINALELRYIIQSCDFTKLTKFTISFDAEYTGPKIDADLIQDIAMIMKDSIASLSFVEKEGVKQNFTLNCQNVGTLEYHQNHILQEYAKGFGIILNGDRIESVARSVA